MARLTAATPSASPHATSTTSSTGGDNFTSVSKVLMHSYHVGVIVVVALVLRWLANRSVNRFARSIASGRLNRGLSRFDNLSDGETVERRTQRSATLGSVLRSVINAVVFTIALILILGELGLDLAPILASAGIVGVAIGFGAQSVVKDFLAGLFLVLEDQYGVGDVVDLQKSAGVTGVVESIGLRSTRVRDVRGNLWHLRNGNIDQVGNISQGWSRILLDVLFPLDVDVAAARAALLGTAIAYAEAHPDQVLEEPAVWGVEDVSTTGVTLRLAVKTRAPVKDDVARALREQLLGAFIASGVLLAGEPVPIVATAAGPSRVSPATAEKLAAPAKAAKAAPAKAAAKAAPSTAAPAAPAPPRSRSRRP